MGRNYATKVTCDDMERRGEINKGHSVSKKNVTGPHLIDTTQRTRNREQETRSAFAAATIGELFGHSTRHAWVRWGRGT